MINTSSVFSSARIGSALGEVDDRSLMTSSRSEWLRATTNRLSELMRLEKGWDSYSGKPLSPPSAYFSMQLLLEVASDKTPAPHLVPTTSGGLQIEWHRGRRSLEILVRRPNHVEVWSRSEDGAERELNLSYRFGELVPLVDSFAVD